MRHDWVEDAAELDAWMERARKERVVALDTEFVWERTYFPRLGVVQLGFADGHCALIDAQTIEDLSPLAGLLGDEGVVKILHDAQQDLMILGQVSGGLPAGIFDTQLAAGLVGLKSTLSLAGLTEECLGIELDKGETRSDWLRRPLSTAQLAYACADVLHLHAMREALLDRARERGRVDWIAEEMHRYEDACLYAPRDPGTQYERIKGRKSCSPNEMAALRDLAAWRERTGRERDLPRNFIAPDALLLSAVKTKPKSPQALCRLAERPKVVRRYSEDLWEVLQQGLAGPPLERPDREDARGFFRTLDKKASVLMEILRKRCEEAGVDSVLVATRSDLKNFLADSDPAPDDHALLRSWRREVAGEALLEARNGEPGSGDPNAQLDLGL